MISTAYNFFYSAYLDHKIETLQRLVDSDPAIARHKVLERRILEVHLKIIEHTDEIDEDADVWEVRHLHLVSQKEVLEGVQVPLTEHAKELLSQLGHLKFSKWVFELQLGRRTE
ncbi:uncharacterized protein H6S33_010890 [Morchella sextelata]|uniref:uncharacterized protein n=1 Tax=Morchella sextelata TaxID=1174677 RepID=UPI001D03A535|nr:uncharacterized protein H6S33_010890 [Morchella sextelata]KAH0611625.1 hypothetical protein H6S33_010890 [Morchella sextelata]